MSRRLVETILCERVRRVSDRIALAGTRRAFPFSQADMLIGETTGNRLRLRLMHVSNRE
jgi:hypothetical protein